MTMGRENGESSGSDSEPSADNLDEEELAQIVPDMDKKKKEEKKPVPLPIKTTKKKEPPPKPMTQVVKEIQRSPPVKKPGNYNPFDRLSIRKHKPEMKDAWTQTTPRPRDERRAKRHREERERQQ
jgi:hypothetical protein